MEQREHGRFLRRVRQRTRDRDRRMAAPPAGGTGSAKEPDRHGSTDLANAPSFPRAGDENTPGCNESIVRLSRNAGRVQKISALRFMDGSPCDAAPIGLRGAACTPSRATPGLKPGHRRSGPGQTETLRTRAGLVRFTSNSGRIAAPQRTDAKCRVSRAPS